MSRFVKNCFLFILFVGVCSSPCVRADGVLTPTPASVTGGAPEPISPTVMDFVLYVLQLA
jgi:hypothetical protein